MNLSLIEVLPLVDPRIIKESLTRLGIPSYSKKTLYPSAYLLQLENKYFLVHFKMLFVIQDENAFLNLTDEDISRLHSIIFLLKLWKLIDVDETQIPNHKRRVFVLPYKDKQSWKIVHKVNINSLKT